MRRRAGGSMVYGGSSSGSSTRSFRPPQVSRVFLAKPQVDTHSRPVVAWPSCPNLAARAHLGPPLGSRLGQGQRFGLTASFEGRRQPVARVLGAPPTTPYLPIPRFRGPQCQPPRDNRRQDSGLTWCASSSGCWIGLIRIPDSVAAGLSAKGQARRRWRAGARPSSETNRGSHCSPPG